MKSVHILLVEDNQGDILLTTEALEESKIINTLSVVQNGKEALDYLFKKGAYQQAKTPDLILLDINLPLKNGHEVLEVIKADPDKKHIPVIMLTTSSSEKDISKAYQQHANCYITKPLEVTDFFEAIKTLEQFWMQIVKLPTNTS